MNILLGNRISKICRVMCKNVYTNSHEMNKLWPEANQTKTQLEKYQQKKRFFPQHTRKVLH